MKNACICYFDIKKLLTPNLSIKNLSKNCYFYPWNIKDLINENKFKESFFHNNNNKKTQKTQQKQNRNHVWNSVTDRGNFIASRGHMRI